jgi:hypothetical protein
MTLRIYVDFNTMMMDERERVTINPYSNRDLMHRLRPGMRVILSDETLEVEAELMFDAAHGMWLGEPNWSTSRDLPLPESMVEAKP